ncbi:MAG TPA: ABC transporter permease [Candidatus Nanopelagicaceae bacterium]
MTEEYQSDESLKSKTRIRRMKIGALQIAISIALLGSWQFLTDKKILDPFFFGKPTGVAHQLAVWFQHGTDVGSIWLNAWVTFEEATLGFLAGVILGIIFGVFLGRNRLAAEVFAPYIKVSNSIPRIILGSIFIVWLGLGTISKVALAFVLVFFPVFFNAFQGTREADRKLISNARLLGASKRQVTRSVVMPSALSWITASMHVSFGFALIGAIVGEFLGSQHGLGLIIATAQGTFNPNGVYAAMLIIAVMALSAEWLITKMEDRLLNWRPTQVSGTEI